MRILLVSHRFPPLYTAGTESYTFELARALVARGHFVRVLTGEKDISHPDLSASERSVPAADRPEADLSGGAPAAAIGVDEVTNNLHYDSFSQTYDLPKVARFAVELCERHAIDVVHVQHVLHLSAGLVEAIAATGRPVFFTLHDYWLSCPRMGQRVHAEGTVCHTVETARCGDCMSRTKWRQSKLEQRVARRLAGIKSVSGLDLSGVAQNSANFARNVPSVVRAPALEAERAREMQAQIETRSAWILEHLVPHVARFFAPSHFLLERMVEWGLPEERCEYLPLGLPDSFHRRPVPPAGVASPEAGSRSRVAFLGTCTRLKGPHLLLEAWQRLPSELRERAELVIYGPLRHDPDYVRELGRLARAVGARLAGPIAREEIPATLAAVDLLVVPSTWYENSPLAMLEAQAVGTPLLVSNLGGMAELVRDDPAGWTFEVGSADDLARALAERLSDPAALRAAGARELELPSLQSHVDRLLEHYESSQPSSSGTPA